MIDYFIEFFEKYDYPKEAINDLLSAYQTLLSNQDANSIFQSIVKQYEVDDTFIIKDSYPQLEEVARKTDLSPYTIYLLFFLSLSKIMKEKYIAKNYSIEIFYKSMADLKYKMLECYKLHNIYGNCVPWWEDGFFQLTRVGLGRLQYEIVEQDTTLVIGGHLISKGDPVINMHIPSSGPLTVQDCMDSFGKAAEFYKEYFKERPTVFVCDSWLLFPYHLEFLPKDSNILNFIKLFTIYSTEIDENKYDLWRIFYKDTDKPLSELPRTTSLQRAYADWLLNGKPVGCGKGIFLFQDEKIIS
ncbi:acyltransferase domain-containing protein [Lachnoclostridium sp.]|uniref:acyltransferase domain-containing protein n=1 Tax=Lachnoclostridium sp. TaxID=2028282 RepID=UPI00289B1780|nr:acyltransferase domain-containing protein [Lachnoclostridium sp.]